MKKIFLKIVIGVVLACILFVCFLYTNNEIGVTSSKLEADIRSSQKIKDDWTVDGSVSSTMAAYNQGGKALKWLHTYFNNWRR